MCIAKFINGRASDHVDNTLYTADGVFKSPKFMVHYMCMMQDYQLCMNHLVHWAASSTSRPPKAKCRRLRPYVNGGRR